MVEGDYTNNTAVLRSLSADFVTDVGLLREENQDFFGQLIGEDLHLYLVADGMGGARGGATAAKLAVEEIVSNIDRIIDINEAAVVDAVRIANNVIHQGAKKEPRLAGMGTTIVGLVFTEQGSYVFHVGDSRAYRFHGGELERLTKDHSLAEDLPAELTRKGKVPGVGHVLTRSLGPTADVTPDCARIADIGHRSERFLLCSDGLYNLVSTSEIAAILNSRPRKQAVADLVELAKVRGGKDNITVCVIDFVGEDQPSWQVTLDTDPLAETDSLKEDSPHIAVTENGSRKSDHHLVEELHLEEGEDGDADDEDDESELDYEYLDDDDAQYEDEYEDEDYDRADTHPLSPSRRLGFALLVIAGIIGFLLGLRVAWALLGEDPQGDATEIEALAE